MTNPDFQRAVLLASLGRWKDAINTVGRVLSHTPEDPDCHTLLALCHAMDGQAADAQESAAASIKLNPTNPFSHLCIALAHLHQRRFKLAEQHLAEAGRLHEADDAFSHLIQAQIALLRHSPRAAFELSSRALALEPTDPEILSFHAKCLITQHRFEDASEVLRVGLTHAPSHAELHRDLAITSSATGRTREALTHIETSLRLDPDDEISQATLLGLLRGRYLLQRLMRLGVPSALRHGFLAIFLFLALLPAVGSALWAMALVAPRLEPFAFVISLLGLYPAMLIYAVPDLLETAMLFDVRARLILRQQSRVPSLIVAAATWAAALVVHAFLLFVGDVMLALIAGWIAAFAPEFLRPTPPPAGTRPRIGKPLTFMIFLTLLSISLLGPFPKAGLIAAGLGYTTFVALGIWRTNRYGPLPEE